MSRSRKLLKIMSFAQVILLIASLVVGVGLLTNEAPDETNMLIALSPHTWSLLTGVIAICSGIGAFVSAALGIRGSNRPRKLSPHFALTLIALILVVVEGVLLITALVSLHALIGLIVACVLIIVDIAALVFDRGVTAELDR